MKLISQNRTIYYEVHGKGNPLILLHGLPLDLRIWNPILPELQKKFKCITLDFPGFGKSVNNDDSTITFEELKFHVKAVLDTLNISKCVLLGHSFGGYVAQDFASELPEYILKLVLVSTKASEDSDEKKKERIFFAQELLEKRYSEYIKLQSEYCSNGGEYDRLISNIISENVTWHMASLLQSLAARKSFLEKVRSFSFPVQIIVGENDTDFLSESELLHKAISHSQFSIIPQAKHMVFTDNLEEFILHLPRLDS